MQLTETLSQGLKREYKVVLSASDLAERLDGQLVEMKDKVRINGFRPGKVPVAHLKRVYGRSMMAEVMQEAINEANKKIVEDNHLRLAMEPKVEFPEDREEIEKVLEAKGDLAFTVSLETLPQFDVGRFDDIELERPVAVLEATEVEAGVNRLGDRNRTYTAKDGTQAKAETGDKVTIDFLGTLNDEAFEGGNGNDTDVVLGSDSFIPGFEEQLLGMKVGEERKIDVTFPTNYTVAKLAGQPAKFAVTLKKIQAPEELAINDEFAKQFGFEDIAGLQDAVRGNLQRDLDRASRDKVKRALLDALDKRHSFELPQSLVDMEFDNIWRQVEAEQKASGRSFEDEKTTEAEAREEYRRIAARRVRLGLLLAEVGDQAKIEVTQEELTGALVERARAFPGQEKMVWDFYQKNPQALAEIRAPLFEEKVIDHILAQAKVVDKTVSREELFKLEEDEEQKAEK